MHAYEMYEIHLPKMRLCHRGIYRGHLRHYVT